MTFVDRVLERAAADTYVRNTARAGAVSHIIPSDMRTPQATIARFAAAAAAGNLQILVSCLAPELRENRLAVLGCTGMIGKNLSAGRCTHLTNTSATFELLVDGRRPWINGTQDLALYSDGRWYLRN
jgi:hypothetical protein